MTEDVKVVVVDGDNVDEEGFFCYKSKPKAVGFQRKLDWLRQRFAEGLKIRILYKGKRSFAFIEYLPGEYAWRAVDAAGYMFVHCLWTVGKGKNEGYATRLLSECTEDAHASGQRGVAMLTSSRPWLVGSRFLLKRGFALVDTAPPSFELLVKEFDGAPSPAFPQDWEERRARYGSGLTVVRADQCPYMEDAVRTVTEVGEELGIPTRVVEFQTAEEVRESAPTPYGVFGVVLDGELLTHQHNLKKMKEELLEKAGGAAQAP
jgi:hypothetical protein